MNRHLGVESGPLPRRVWLFAVVGVLSLVVLGVAYVQWRQYKLLDTAAHFQSDALGWSFSQLETEQLRLRNEMQRYLADPQHPGAENVQMRYDIFVSRVGLVDHPRAAGIMQDQIAYLPAMAQVRAFIQQADHVLGPSPSEPLAPANAQQLMAHLEALNLPLHDLSLGASHLLYQRATERNQAVRLQSELGVALTAFQVVLLLALAFIVLRQLRTLTERRLNLEALAASLSAARQGAEAANRAKSAFLANMSHEIRTPFHGMLGMMSLLQDSRLSPQQSVYLDTARESAHHLLTILNDILDISQLESGKLQVTPQTVDLLQLLHQVDALMHAQAQAKGLALRVDVAPDVPRWVRTDPTRVRQILFNLLSNALKFTNEGGVTLDVACGAGGHLELTVTDTGIGMDEATQARLFQRFMQGDERPSRRTSGTGLGLQISRDLARLMGGDITVQSRPGAGSSFTVSLPLTSVGAPALAPDEGVPAGADGTRPLRVLVAEDHAVNRAYLEAVLDKLGHHGVFVTDGHGAVQAVQNQTPEAPFDVVLMDLHMPDMDGFSAARTIRAMPAPHGRVPIVALTADAFQTSRELAREAGMDGFLTKPAHLPQLREALQRWGGGAAPFAAAQATVEAATTAAADAPTSLLDRPTIDDVRHALTPAKYGELLSRLLDDRAALVGGLRDAVIEASHTELRSRAHSLKGAAASLGLRAVSAAAQQLQVSAPDTSERELLQLLDQLDAQFELSLDECMRGGLVDSAVTPPAARAPA
jgi:signal transduction histidine kinase/DNA-binding response OmpR family regulator